MHLDSFRKTTKLLESEHIFKEWCIPVNKQVCTSESLSLSVPFLPCELLMINEGQNNDTLNPFKGWLCCGGGGPDHGDRLSARMEREPQIYLLALISQNKH